MAAKIRSEYEIGLRDDTARGAASIKQELRGVAQAAASLGTSFAAIGGGVALAALAGYTRDAINFGDRLNDLAKATDSTVEQLSFLDFAADQSGTSIEAISSGVARLQKNLSTVGKGGGKEAAAALAALNLSANDLSRQDLVSQLGAIGDGLAKIQNPAERSAVAQALFGKGVKELLPLLLEGSQGIGGLADRFVELNGVITQGQASKFDEMNDAIGQMHVAARGAGAAIGDALAPALTSLFSTIAEAVPQVGPFFDAFVNRMQMGFAKLVKFTAEADLAIAESLQSTLGSLPGFDFSDKVEFAKAEVRDAAAVIDEIDKGLDEKITARAQRSAEARKAIAGKGNVFAGISAGGGDGAQAAKRQADAEAAAIAQLGLRKVAEEDVTEVARIRFQIEEGAYKAFSQGTKDRLISIAQEIDLKKQSAQIDADSIDVSKYLVELQEKRTESEKKFADERAKTIESLRTPAEVYADEVKRYLSMDLDNTQLQRGIDKARTALEVAQSKAKDTTETARELGLTFSSAFEDAIVGAQSFSDVLKGLAQDIARILIRKSVTEPLANAFGSILSGFGSGGGGGAGGGGFFDLGGLFGGGRASGGPVSRGKFYMVGENGPELFAPGASGAIVPNTGAGGVVVNVHNYGPQQDINARADGRTVDVFIGGSLAKTMSSGRGRSLGLTPSLAAR